MPKTYHIDTVNLLVLKHIQVIYIYLHFVLHGILDPLATIYFIHYNIYIAYCIVTWIIYRIGDNAVLRSVLAKFYITENNRIQS
jgi:TM2 domain-containing membrane protein YozV